MAILVEVFASQPPCSGGRLLLKHIEKLKQTDTVEEVIRVHSFLARLRFCSKPLCELGCHRGQKSGFQLKSLPTRIVICFGVAESERYTGTTPRLGITIQL